MKLLSKIELDDDVYTLEDFVSAVEDGFFVNSDGSGYYACPPYYDHAVPALPSDIYNGVINHKYTHVAWFNK